MWWQVPSSSWFNVTPFSYWWFIPFDLLDFSQLICIKIVWLILVFGRFTRFLFLDFLHISFSSPRVKENNEKRKCFSVENRTFPCEKCKIMKFVSIFLFLWIFHLLLIPFKVYLSKLKSYLLWMVFSLSSDSFIRLHWFLLRSVDLIENHEKKNTIKTAKNALTNDFHVRIQSDWGKLNKHLSERSEFCWPNLHLIPGIDWFSGFNRV